MNEQLISSGATVNIRWMTFEDLPFLVEVRNECRTFLHDDKKISLQDSVRWWQEQNPTFVIIQLHACNTPVGYMRISHWSTYSRHVMIGSDIHPDYRRQGCATEAYKLLLRYLFDCWQLNKVSLEVLSTNPGALALYDKLGFVREGIKRDEILRDGAYADSIVMSILRREYGAS